MAQSTSEQRSAAVVVAERVRDELPSGRVAVVADSAFNISLNTFVADSLALPSVTRASLVECTAVRKCKVSQGGNAFLVQSVDITGDTALVRVHTVIDYPVGQLVGGMMKDVRLQRQGSSGAWTFVSERIVVRY
jgi:hypothetical protein